MKIKTGFDDHLKEAKQEASVHILSLGHKPVPKTIVYPADFGLANATHQLISQYGEDGAMNRLIEMAERIGMGQDPFKWVFKGRRVDPTQRKLK